VFFESLTQLKLLGRFRQQDPRADQFRTGFIVKTLNENNKKEHKIIDSRVRGRDRGKIQRTGWGQNQ